MQISTEYNQIPAIENHEPSQICTYNIKNWWDGPAWWHHGLSHSLQSQHPISKCWFECHILHFWTSSPLMRLPKQQKKVQVPECPPSLWETWRESQISEFQLIQSFLKSWWWNQHSGAASQAATCNARIPHEYPFVCQLFQLLVNGIGEAMKMAHVLGSLHPHKRHTWSSWNLWPLREWTNDRKFSLLLSVTLTLRIIFFF